MKLQLHKLVIITSILASLLVLPIAANASTLTLWDHEQLVCSESFVLSESSVVFPTEELDYMGMHIITNPTIVSDGREQHQLSAEILAADTETLLQAVLGSEYIRISLTSRILLSSDAEPLSARYFEFNGFQELLSRNDLESALLSYLCDASLEECAILNDIINNSSLQNIISDDLKENIESKQDRSNTYAVVVRPVWKDLFDEYNIRYTYDGTIPLLGGQVVRVKRASREFYANEQAVIDSIYPEGNSLGVVLISSASAYYNCHSYAWHWMNDNNRYWIESTDMYIPDYAVSIEEEDINAYDIVVYYSELGSILHSAIVCDIDDDTIWVQSKWGQMGVYYHALSSVPVGYLGSDGLLRYQVYRYHNYVRTTVDLGHEFRLHKYRHTDICSICGHTVTSNVAVPCGGPPCAVPFALRPED